MPAMRVPAFRCGTDWLSWLVGTDPAMEDGEVHRTVCFSNFNNGCKYSESIKERIKKNKKAKNKKQKTKGKNRKQRYSGQADHHAFSTTTNKITSENDRYERKKQRNKF